MSRGQRLVDTDKNIPLNLPPFRRGRASPRGVDTHIYAYRCKDRALPTGTTSALAFASHSLR